VPAPRWVHGAARVLMAMTGATLLAACTVKETVVYQTAPPVQVAAPPQVVGTGVWRSTQIVGTCTPNATRGGLPLPSGTLCCKANLISPTGRQSQSWTLYRPGAGPGQRIPMINASADARNEANINRYYCTPR
jgi:hypothetical protein